MRSNCFVFALALFAWRWRRWVAEPLRPEPILQIRPTRIGGAGRFVPHFSVVTQRHGQACVHCGSTGYDRYSVVSWKPPADLKDKPHLGHALWFAGGPRRGDFRPTVATKTRRDPTPTEFQDTRPQVQHIQ